eukprot:TRINITY_DN17945_c0_g1_i1.p1 TRINITY_DN17945_c0_g1~~TRINITY_DN17945_c0_g1_i1.p1  ORF type:complete len:630 (+),score=156.06 TRINITY_DN17945_c0_g1_i1:1753-3642(+)
MLAVSRTLATCRFDKQKIFSKLKQVLLRRGRKPKLFRNGISPPINVHHTFHRPPAVVRYRYWYCLLPTMRCNTAAPPLVALMAVLVCCAVVPATAYEEIPLNFTVKGKTYESLDKMIAGEVGWDTWYRDQLQYWQSVPLELDSFLVGGRGHNEADLRESRDFLAEFFPEGPEEFRAAKGRVRRKALDLGAGMGRVTKGVLLEFAAVIDLVEPIGDFIDEAKRLMRDENQQGTYLPALVADIKVEPDSYDLVCIQFLAHALSDADFAALLERIRPALRPNAIVFVKEVLPMGLANEVTVQDARIIRAEHYIEELFGTVDFRAIKKQYQEEWPRDALPVVMYALTAEEVTVLPAAVENEPPVPIRGQDLTEGYHFSSLQSMWQQELKDRHWYEHNKEYWNKRDPKFNNPEIAGIDMVESREFLKDLFVAGERAKRNALDLGAGVGRVASGVLLVYVRVVDLVDQGEHFLKEAEHRLGERNRGGKYITAALQDYTPTDEYDVICLQFTALYMSDDMLIDLLKRLLPHIKEPQGFIFFKDSLSPDGKFMINRDSGHNIVRSEVHYRWIFTQAGWFIGKQSFQQNWLQDANPVVMYALYPVTNPTEQKHAPPLTPPVMTKPPTPAITVSKRRPR